MDLKRWRRRYRPGTCQDCGRSRPVTVAIFWVNAYHMRLCGECIRPYRRQLLRKHPHDGIEQGRAK